MDERPEESAPDIEARLAALERRATSRAASRPLVDRAMRLFPAIALINLFVAVPAVLISVGVAYFTFVQADATQKMQIASSWPHIGYESSNLAEDGSSRITLSLSNKGVGPAMIRGLELTRDGQAFTTFEELLGACCTDDPGALEIGIGSVHGEVLRPGETLMFAQLSPEGTPPQVWERFESVRLGLHVRTCYCSVFSDCWIGESGRFDPEPVEECPADWTQFYGFQQEAAARS